MAQYKGIDVSKWQGNIDWKKVKADGIDFAMLRCGFGSAEGQKDSCFEKNYTNAKAAGIPVGAYHYSYARTVERAKAEAKYCLSLLKGKQFEYPIAFDIEDKTQANLSKQVISNIIRTFCEELENAGYYVVIYANKSWLMNKIDDDCKKRYDIWLAQWADEPTYSGNFGLWQYTDKGRVKGISNYVDMDISYKDYATIIKNGGLNGFSTKTETKAQTKPEVKKSFAAGTEFKLKDVALYASSTAKTTDDKATGTYYLYDGKELNGRYRITNAKTRVNKTPVASNVSGYVNKSDLK